MTSYSQISDTRKDVIRALSRGGMSPYRAYLMLMDALDDLNEAVAIAVDTHQRPTKLIFDLFCTRRDLAERSGKVVNSEESGDIKIVRILRMEQEVRQKIHAVKG